VPSAAISPDMQVASSRSTTFGETAIPWYMWFMAAALTAAVSGAHWDVSWHRSIGRDSFWTLPHMLIYLSGVLAGIAGAYLLFATTVQRKPELVATSISVFGLRAPLGVFLSGWGGMAMFLSAPFDNWWHNAYGVDVKIVSPPHALLILGNGFVGVGGLVLIMAALNRAADVGEIGLGQFRPLQKLVLYMGGIQLVQCMFFLMEFVHNVKLHSVSSYRALGVGVPMILAMISRASRHRWAASIISGIYMLFGIGLMVVLPLFPAAPKLGPVYFPVTHLVPPPFPIPLIVPGLALDLLWKRICNWSPWRIALASGPVFLVTLFMVEWPFAKFLMTKASENWFFGTGYYDYSMRSWWSDYLHIFFLPDSGAALLLGLLSASIFAMVSTWLGMKAGNWMRRVQR
jgi:hypothetical protein